MAKQRLEGIFTHGHELHGDNGAFNRSYYNIDILPFNIQEVFIDGTLVFDKFKSIQEHVIEIKDGIIKFLIQVFDSQLITIKIKK